MKVKDKVTTADGSNPGSIRVVISCITLASNEFEHKFILCKHLLHLAILGLDFDHNV